MKRTTVELGEVCDFLSGFAFKSELFSTEPIGLPIIRIRDVLSGSSATFYCGDHQPQYIVQKGDILIGMDGEFNRERWKSDPALLNQRVCKAIARESLVDNGYLYHALPMLLKKIEDETPFVTVKHLSVAKLKSAQIPLHPLEEQRRIAAILDKASSIGASQQRRTALLWQLEASLFSQMATENVSELNNCMLKELTAAGDKINYGVVQPGNQFDGGVPLIRVGDLVSGGVDRSSIKCIAPAIEAAYTRSRIVGNEILLSCVGSIGVVAMVQPWDIGSNIARAVARVPVSQTVNRKWLAACLRSTPVQRYFVNELRTVSQPTLNIKQIEETIIHLPPIELQNAFAIKLDAIERLCKRSSFSEEKSCNMISAFQSRVFQVVLDPQ